MATKKAAKSVKTAVKKAVKKTVEKPAEKPAKKAAKKAVKTAVKKATKKSAAKVEALEPVVSTAPEVEVPAATPTTGIADPIGDTTDGEAKTYLGEDLDVEENLSAEAEYDESDADDASGDEDEDSDVPSKPRPPAKLERLQKILSQAGVASRRKAEEMIEQGRVQVNGKVVTALGTKADANRDHVRVDGKLLHGAERLRYFVLNKPKGFVTTVKDPEGRPTVMQFFDKMKERLYPVGRLDYMSEGLLLVTNDGELANKLTKAGSGVEKVYLVKVAGQPTEEELDLLRAGVNIERGKPGSPQVRTSPARIRQVRQGDNPWYEVVLIEGRNRELRKMFVAVGHFVEKIRRVGYGPLVLDQEPGNMRELDAQELAALRLASEGKLRTPKAKDVRRRNIADGQLPTVRPKPSSRPFTQGKPFEPRKTFEPGKPLEPRKYDARPAAEERGGQFRSGPSFDPSSGKDRPVGDRPYAGRTFDRKPAGRPFQDRSASGRPAFGKPAFGKPAFDKPAWKKDDRGPRPPARFAAGASGDRRPPAAGKPFGDRPATPRLYGAKPAGKALGDKPAGRPFADRSAGGRPPFNKPAFDKPAFKKPEWKKPGGRSDRPPFKSPAAPRREPPVQADDFVPFKPGSLRIEPVEHDRPEPRAPRTFSKPPAHAGAGRPPFDRPRTGKPAFGKPRFERPGAEKPRFDRAGSDRPSFDGRTGAPYRPGAGPARSARPTRAEGGLARPFTTSSGVPRPGGARPSSKPFKPGGKSGFKPRPGGFSKSGAKGGGFKGKPGGAKRSGPRPGGKKRG